MYRQRESAFVLRQTAWRKIEHLVFLAPKENAQFAAGSIRQHDSKVPIEQPYIVIVLHDDDGLAPVIASGHFDSSSFAQHAFEPRIYGLGAERAAAQRT